MLKNTKIGTRLFLGFGAVLILAFGLGTVGYHSIGVMFDLTEKMYRHPFTVSNAVRAANGHILAMQRDMKNLLLAADAEERHRIVDRVEELEEKVLANFKTVEERFLGSPAQVDQVLHLVYEWRPIRAEEILLLEQGRHDEAVAMTKGTAAAHVERINEHMAGLIQFALGKADEYLANSTDEHDRVAKLVIGLTGLIVFSGAAIAWAISRGITTPLMRITHDMTDIAGGGTGSDILEIDRGDEVGELARAARVFKGMVRETATQNWIKTAVADISVHAQQATDQTGFAREIVSRLAPLVEAGHGVFYLWNEESKRLELLGSYGYKHRRHVDSAFALGEGLVGQCALERKPIVLTAVPDDYIAISSGLGEAPPRTISVVPVTHRDTLLGVVEVATFDSFDARREALIEALVPVIGLNLENLNRTLRTRELLEQSRQQAEELRASEEELRASEEELRAQREQLQVINDELREKTATLEQQTAELRAAEEEQQAVNEELREKTEILERQAEKLRQAQQEADAKAREVEQASRYKSEFLANMSHELRTPLNSLLILAKSLADNDDGSLGDEQVESARIIHDSGAHLLRLINDILDISKIEAGKAEVLAVDVDLAEFAADTERHFRHIAKDKGLGFSVSTTDGLPPTIRTDRGKLEQIVFNLLSNAFKFTEKGEVRLSVSPTAGGGEVAIAVSDTGPGIPADKFDHVFDAFTQLDGSMRRKHGGTGLGLSISRRLAHLLGGEVLVESPPGGGATFTLTLPVGGPVGGPVGRVETRGPSPSPSPSSVRSPVPSPAPPPVVVDPPGGDLTPPPFPDDRDAIGPDDRPMLVVEDDTAFARILCDMVRKKGFKCLAADSGRGALALAGRFPLAGIVLDIGLPDMDGWSVMDRLKQGPHTRHIPVHFITAADEPGRALRQGAVGYLTKPVSREQINGALERISHFLAEAPRRVLLIEDDPNSRKAIATLLETDGIELTGAASGEEALQQLAGEAFDCLILDLGLPGMNGFEFLDRARGLTGVALPPVVVYSGRDLDDDEELKLREFTDSVVIKGARSPERLLDEVTLFLHKMHADLSDDQKRMLEAAQAQGGEFAGRKVLVVDDDMRNTFALSKALRARAMNVLMAKDGRKALAQLDAHPDVDVVLMDVMMPEMDGLEATREIRKQDRFRDLPIIMVTAKAMHGDRDKCLAAGASDYLSKPIDMDRLLSMMRAWL